jgi:large subunit ribosomal protein MRP49
MIVNRTTDQEGPAVMTILFTETENTSPPKYSTNEQTMTAPGSEIPPVAPSERTVMINMKHRHESEILSQLMSITKAVPVEPTPEELQQIRDLEEQRLLSERDSKKSQAFNERKRHEEAMLAQARGEVAAAQEA